MVTQVVIRDNKKTPIGYLPDVRNFKNGKVFNFKTGVNIIVGKNGSGKTTLLKLIQNYLLVDEMQCGVGIFNSNINALFRSLDRKGILDGVEVYADYEKNTFRLCHVSERSKDKILENAHAFNSFFEQKHSSTGEGVGIAIQDLFQLMFGGQTDLKFNYDSFNKTRPAYYDYIQRHRITDADEYTVLMDEPDRNFDIENAKSILEILSFHKPRTQIIAVIHNPLLIYNLSRNPEVNIIEMTRGYVKSVRDFISSMT